MSLLTVEVARRTQATPEITCFDLVPAAGTTLPGFSPGAHVDVHLRADLIRAYSLCNDSAERGRYRIAVLREPHSRGGSALLCDTVRAGDRLSISAPRNNFPLRRARRSLLLGGGIGMAPLLPMAQQLARDGADFALHGYYTSRSRAAFVREIGAAAWSSRAQLHFSDEAGSSRQRLADMLAGLDEDTHVYACGPAGFVEHVIRCAALAGLDERQIHYEPFALPTSMKPDCRGPAFQVRLRSSGRVYTIPADEPPTRALARQGVRIPVSCEEGNCGTCLTGVLEGIPDHRDVCLDAAERARNRQFAPCCSRSRTPLLVLDL